MARCWQIDSRFPLHSLLPSRLDSYTGFSGFHRPAACTGWSIGKDDWLLWWWCRRWLSTFPCFSMGHDSIRFSFIFFHLLSLHIHDTCDCEQADENLLAEPLSLHYISFELSTNRDMYSTRNACDDLLRQYHLFTVLHFCRECSLR